MNKVYKVVWNASLGIWVAVSELAKGKTKSSCLNEEQHNNDNSITNKLQDKLFFLKPLSFAIITILIPSFVFAETGVNGGTSSQNNSTAISPSNAQCGTLSAATISGTSTNSTAIGCGTTIDSAPDSVAIGKQNTISATNTTNQQIADRRTGASLVNYPTGQTGYSSASVAIGTQNTTGAGGGVAIGNGNQVDSAFHGVAIGQGNRTTGGYAVSLGIGNAASGVSAVSVGTANDASGNTAVAIGRQTYSKADYGIAVGNVATVEVGATNGIAIGNTASVLGTATNSVAIGKDATSNVSNSVALGAGSTTTAQSGSSFLTNVAASATNGVVSVGTTSATRRIQNVADGAADQDAVTVAQLKDVNNRAVGNTTALGGGAAYDPSTNVYTAPTFTTTKTDGTTVNSNTVSGALTNLNNEVVKPITFNGNTGTSTNKLGSTLNITGTSSTAGTYSGNNLQTSVSGNTVSIQMADAPVFTGTVTAGNLATGGTLSVTGVSNLNGGANLNNQKITNVAAGTASGDAVNFGQLTTTNNNVTTAQNAANAAQTSANAAQTTANSALTEAQKGLNFRANAGATDKVSLGETVTLADGTNTTVTYDAATNTYKYSVVDAPTFTGTVTAGNLATGGTLSVTGVSNLNGGANLNNQKITNVAAGTASGDAVNFGQLTTTNNNVTTAQNAANAAQTSANAAQTTANSALTEAQKGLNFRANAGATDKVSLGETVTLADGTNTTVTYDAATNTYKYNVVDAPTFTGTVTAGNLATGGTLSVTGVSNLNGGANLNNQKITNVAAGTASGDAVNFGQLTTTNNNVTTAQNAANAAQTLANAAQTTANSALTEAQKGINFGDGSTSNNYALGETINIKGDSNVNSVTTADGVQLSLASDISVDSVTTGNSKLDNSGLTITGGPSITTAGIDAANTNISNVADATTADQAVNKGQLDAATAAADDKTDALGNSTASNLGGGATYNSTTGAVTAPTYTVNGTDVNNVGAAISELDKGWNLASNGANAGAIKAGDTVDIGTAAGETNLQVAKSGNTIQYSLSRDLDLDSVTTGNSKLDNSGLTITGGPSITTAGIDAANTNISNVADATTADQAVNKGQLDAATAAADDKTDALGNSTASNLGGGATYNSTTGAVTAPTYTVNGTDVNNVGAAISELDKGWNLASNGANAGAIKAGDTVDIGTAAGETNLQVAKSGNTIQYSLSRDLDLDSVTTGNSKLDNSGLTITGGPSITTAGIDAANTNISNVADATTADQAVNKGQLDAATAAADDKTDALGNSTASNLGGGATYNSTTGAVTAPTYTVNGTDVNNVGAAISELDKGWNLASNGANAGAIKAGDTVDIGTAAGETNLQVAKSGNTIQYSLSRDLDLDSVTTGNSKLDNSGLTITGGPSITTAGIDAANTNISNVADATTADQAVNKGQLDAATAAADDKTDALGNSTASNLGGGATYNSTTGAVTAPTYTVNGTDVNNVGAAISELDKGWNLASNGANAGAIKAGDTVDIGTAAGETNLQVAKSGNTIQYSLSRDLDLDSVTTGNSKLDNSGLTITGGPSITTAGIDAANTNISNVADATTADQAVNKGQLDAATAAADDKTDALGNSTASNLGGGATYNSTTGAVTAPTYTVNGTDVNNVGAAISELDKGWNLASNGANAGAIKAGDTVDIGTAAGETNLQVAKSGNTIQYSLSRDLDLDSVTTGNSKLDNSGLTITGGPSITTAGIDAANTNISNVADATTADQAVNKGQLDAATAAADDKTDALGNSTASNLGGGATYNSTTGAVTAPTYTVNGTDVNNVGAAISELDKGWNLASNGANAGAIKAGDTVDIGTAAGETNLQVAKSGNTIQYSLSRDLDLDSVTTGNSKLDNSGLTITGGPSITTAGIDAANTNISNVADATTADQAVNKGQLDAATAAADDKTDALGNSTASNLGGGATYNSTTGAVTAPTYTVNGTDVNNVGAAISELDKGWNLASNGANAGAIKAGDTVDIGTAAGETNLQVAKSGNTIQYSLSRDLDLDSVTTGNSKLDNSGLTITGGPSITTAGIDAANTNISNVADATTADQAVNKGQLDAATAAADDKTDALGNSTASNLGGGATYNSTTGAVTAPTYTVNGTDVNNVGAAISELDKGWNLASNGANAGAIKAGDTVDIGTAAGETNLQVAKSGNTIQYSLSRDLDLDSVTTGNSKLDNSGLTITGGPSITTAGIDAANTNISNVADATTADQAVNKGQLDALASDLAASDNAAVRYDDAAVKDKVTLAGATGTTLTNVKAGDVSATSTDAVNGSQLFTTNQKVDQNTTNIATNTANIAKNTGDISTLNTTVTNQGNEITTLKGGFNLQTNGTNAGAIKAGDTVDIGVVDPADTNLTATKTANNVAFALSKDLTLTSVTTGNTVINSAGLTADKLTVGNVVIDKATNKISGVEAGTDIKDVVNKGQLDALASDLAASDNAAVRYDDAAVKDKVTLAGATGTTLTNVKAGDVSATSTDAVNGSQLFTTNQKVDQNTTNIATNTANIAKNTGDISTLNTTVTNQGNEITTLKGGFNLQTNGTNAGAIKAGDTVDIGVVDPADTNLTATKTANNVAFALSKDLTLTSVTTGNTVINSAGLTADKLTVGNVVIDKATNKISGVEAGTDIKDVVNKGQLDALASDLAASDNAAVRYDDAAVKDKVTLAGATGTTLTNVKAGDVSATSTDAVNGSQLFTTNQKVDQNTTNIATNTANIAKNTGDISTLNTTVTNQGNEITTLKGGFNLQTNGTNAGAIKAGDTVDIGVADPADTNLTATKTGNNVAFALSKDLSLNSVNANQLAVGDVVVDKSTNTISGLSNKDLTAADFATQGRAATEEQLKQVISSNITEVVDGNGNKVNIIDQVVNTKPDNKNQDSLFLTYDKQGQETTDRLTIAQTVQKMNTEGVKFFHTNADTSKGDLGTTNDSSAGGLNSTAVGVNAIVETDAVSALAVGHNTKAGGAQSIAIGNGSEALGTQSISIGTGNKVTGDHSGAIGDPTIVDGSNSYSVGNNNQVLTDDTFVLGNNVTQTVTGSVVLGTGSAATTGAGVAGYALSTATTADKTAISNTTSTTGAVAIGDAANGIYRQITGVAAGSQDSDAVNVAQLKAVGNQVTTTQTSLVNSLGGNAKVNADGSITGPTYNVAQGTQTNVGDALTALDQAIGNAATTSKTTVSNGENIVVSKTKNADGSDNYQVSTAKDLTVDSIKAGETVLNNAGIAIANNAVVLNNTGLVIAGGPSVTTQGINAGNKQVTNVAAGTNATDAVNKGQLDSAINNVNNNVNQLANNAVKYDDATKDKITLGGANGTTISNVKDGTVAQSSKEAVNGGQLWNVQQQVNQNTSDIENIQTNINNINNGKSGLVQQQTPNGDITIGKDTGGTKVSVAGKDGDRVVTGVKDGVISATSKDAVNGSQLNVTNNKVVEFLGGGAGYDNITNSFTNPTYTVGGKEYNNVGGAVDALNKADQALDSKIDNVSNRLEQAFYSTNQRIDDVEKRANAGIAAAMALEAAPFVAGKYTYAAGASYHGGENAVGVTLRKTADNGRWSITGGVAAASQGDPSVRIGISGVID
ncbi:ESPR-type extended signal peptide-containing protein [Acinetobacter junii]|uniref:ESPR-type extended signal peptide-containing protein n=1 Tax=Acinetobacter junii TaxID=40215 RepID=UPI00366CF487